MDLIIEVENTGEIERNVKIEVPRSEYKKEFDKALQRATSVAQIKGFRKGKVPKDLLLKMYGESIHYEVLDDLTMKVMQRALEEKKMNVVGRPKVSYEDEKDESKNLKIKAEVQIFPEPKVTDYENLKLAVEVRKLDDSEFVKTIGNLQDQQATYLPAEGNEISKGDIAVLDVHLTDMDAKTQHLHDRKMEVGKGLWPKEVEEALVGMKLDEEKEVVVIAVKEESENSSEDSRTTTFHLKLKAIESKKLPELNDEFAKNSGLAETLDQLNSKLKEDLEKNCTRENDEAKEKKLLETLIEKTKFTLPEELIDFEIRNLLFQMGALNPKNKKSFDLSMEPFRARLGEQAEFKARSAIILDCILKQEGFNPSREDITAWITDSFEKWGYKNKDDFEKDLGFPDDAERIKVIMGRDSMLKKLLSQAKITEKVKKE